MFITTDDARQILLIVKALEAGELTTSTIPTECAECGETDAWELEREHITYRMKDEVNDHEAILSSVVIVCCEGFIPVKFTEDGQWVARKGDGSDCPPLGPDVHHTEHQACMCGSVHVPGEAVTHPIITA